ncbi:MAG: PAS domain S-box protein [Candidatus Odinarchaeota archaeon]
MRSGEMKEKNQGIGIYEPYEITVLHIDDDVNFIDLTKTYVENLGKGKVIIHGLSNPTETFSHLKEGKYDVIVSDYIMPYLDGLELLKKIRDEKITIPFIIFTGQSREEVAIKALNLGVSYYIIKGGEPSSMYAELLHIIQTIVDHDRIEKALKLSEERFRIAFHTSPDPINISRLDDGVYVDVNEGFTTITGFTREEVINRSAISPELDIWYDPADRMKLVEGLKRNGSCNNLDVKFRMKDGTVREGLVSAKIIMLGNVPHLLSVTRDISDWKKAERNLEESEQKYKALTENLDLGVFRIQILARLSSKILEVNPAFLEIFGYESLEKVLNLDVGEFYATLEERLKFYDIVEKQGRVKRMEVKLKRKTGEIFTGLISGTVVRYDHTKMTILNGIIEDITERKAKEIQLMEKIALLESKGL